MQPRKRLIDKVVIVTGGGTAIAMLSQHSGVLSSHRGERTAQSTFGWEPPKLSYRSP